MTCRSATRLRSSPLAVALLLAACGGAEAPNEAATAAALPAAAAGEATTRPELPSVTDLARTAGGDLGAGAAAAAAGKAAAEAESGR